MAFTDSKIRSLKPETKRTIVWEDGQTCLGVRISPKGKKSFIFMYRFEGTSKMLTIGEYPKVSLSEARIKLAKAKAQLEKGVNPGQQAQEIKAANRGAPTVSDLVDEYLEKWAKPKKKSWEEDKRILEKDVIPRWRKRKAKDIQRRDIILLLDTIVERGAPIAANRTLGIIRKMFRFAVGRDILPSSPCVEIVAPGKEQSRDRVLSDTEIKEFWFGLDDAKMAVVTKLALKLLLTTAQRKGEITNAEWSEFNIKDKWWTIPATKAKNNLAHRVPLSPLALRILIELKKTSGNSKWLFPSPIVHKTKKSPEDNPITARSLSQALRNNQIKPKGNATSKSKHRNSFEIPKFVPHDLRRTAASAMASIGIPRFTISKILNHVEGGVTATYDRHSYDNDKKKALDVWSRKLESILTGKKGKVINMNK